MIIFLSFLTIIVNWKETVFPFILTQCHVIFLRTECKKKISLWRWNFTTTQKWSFRVWGLWKRKRSVTKYRRNFCHQQWRFRYMVYTVSSSIILDKIERTWRWLIHYIFLCCFFPSQWKNERKVLSKLTFNYLQIYYKISKL